MVYVEVGEIIFLRFIKLSVNYSFDFNKRSSCVENLVENLLIHNMKRHYSDFKFVLNESQQKINNAWYYSETKIIGQSGCQYLYQFNL